MVNMSFVKDCILNIAASFLLTGVVQIVCYPLIGYIFEAEEYGLILTLTALANAIGVGFGNSLNNVHLLEQNAYTNPLSASDFNRILAVVMPLGFFAALGFSVICFEQNFCEAISIALISLLVLFRSYYLVAFRIHIDYVKNFIATIVGSFGYLLGILIVYITGIWQICFLFGESFACVYLIRASGMIGHSNGLSKTNNFSNVVNRYKFLLSASILSVLMTYMDRLFLYPFLGAEDVAYYTVASFLGKTVGIAIGPIAGVLLSYYAKEEDGSLSRTVLVKRVLGIGSFCSIAFVFLLFAGPTFLYFFYPRLADSAAPYFVLATAAAVVLSYGNTFQPTVLKSCAPKWQTIIQVVYLVVYVSLAFVGILIGQLFGFCCAVLLANLVRLAMMIVVAAFSCKAMS